MDASTVDFLSRFPFLIELRRYYFVGLYGAEYKVTLHFPQFPRADGMRVTIFRGAKTIPWTSNVDYSEADAVVDSVVDLLQQYDSKSRELCTDNFEVVKLLARFESIQRTLPCKLTVDRSLSKVYFTSIGMSGKHFINLQQASGTLYKVLDHSLPELGQSAELFKWPASVEHHVQRFHDTLQQLDDFYSTLNTLDELCCIVDPVTVDTKTTWRTIKYDQKVFIKITLNPLQIADVLIKFVGPSKAVEELRERYVDRLEEWDSDADVHTNLLRIFEIVAFPTKASFENDDIELEGGCGICLCYRDADQRIPMISCDNEKCSLIFHLSCLKEWFQSQKGSKTFFSISIGICPYCKQKISSNFDDMLET